MPKLSFQSCVPVYEVYCVLCNHIIFSLSSQTVWDRYCLHFIDVEIEGQKTTCQSLQLVNRRARFFFFVFCLFRTSPTAYRGSQARGQTGAVAAGLHHNHSNTGSQPCLGPTLQLTATLDPYLTH